MDSTRFKPIVAFFAGESLQGREANRRRALALFAQAKAKMTWRTCATVKKRRKSLKSEPSKAALLKRYHEEGNRVRALTKSAVRNNGCARQKSLLRDKIPEESGKRKRWKWNSYKCGMCG